MKYVTALLVLVMVLSLALPARAEAQLFENFNDVAEIHADDKVVLEKIRGSDLNFVRVVAKKIYHERI